MEIAWAEIFLPTTSPLEIVVRGTVMYLALFLALRFFLKRNTGEVGVADLLVVVLISEASQNALVGDGTSIVDAALAVGVILFWSYAINWLSFRIPALARLTGGAPLPLILDGKLVRNNMRRELITYDELMSQLRQHGVDEVAKVKTAFLEGDGSFSVVRLDDGETESPEKRAVT